MAWRTIERASQKLGIKGQKEYFSGRWAWELPRRPPTPPYRESGGLGDGKPSADLFAHSGSESGGLRSPPSEGSDLSPDGPNGGDGEIRSGEL